MSAGVIAAHYVAGAGALTQASMLATAQALATESATPAPTQGGALTLAGSPVGQYDYVVKDGPVTISAFNEPDWFTSREDIASAFVIVKGNLTINAGQTLRPAKRKLFTVVYVQGDLVVNGSISMTARGANHSGEATYSGGYTAPVALQVDGALTIPAAGGAGGAGVRGDSVTGPPGGAGVNGGSGGGGGGGLRYGQSYGSATDGFGGRGAAGTCFSGGGGGGGVRPSGRPWADAGANGGHGGPGWGDGFGSYNMGSGAGNPGIAGQWSLKGNDGTGGTLIVICTGTLSGTGTIISAGVDGTLSSSTASGAGGGGGGSGGGSVTVLRAVAGASVPTVSAPGGVAPTSGLQVNGGNGGAGSVRTAVPT